MSTPSQPSPAAPSSAGRPHTLPKRRKKTRRGGARQKKRRRQRERRRQSVDPSIAKYYRQRYSLFSLFDRGIRMDPESWYSVTPEAVARHHALRLACGTIIDAFCGVGGNTIQFARTCNRVIAIDIDAERIERARHNAAIYGVQHKIEFLCGDFLELSASVLPAYAADAVFLSPPWGGPSYLQSESYALSSMPIPAKKLWNAARRLSPNVAFFLPRTVVIDDIRGLGEDVEVEANYLNDRLKAATAYWGEMAHLDDNDNGQDGVGDGVGDAMVTT